MIQSPEPVELRPGLLVTPVQRQVEEALVPAAAEHRVLVNVGRPYRLLETLDSRERATAGLPGDVAVVPAGFDLAARSRDGTPQGVSTVVVAVAPQVLDEALSAAGSHRTPGLTPVVGARSPAVAPLTRLLQAGLDDTSGLGRLALESTGLALVAALARDHTSARTPTTPAPAGLSRGQLERVVRHVEEDLAGPLSVAELAALAAVSEFHFSRQFRAATGASPHQYVLSRRLARARQLLTSTDLPIAAVAARCGFADQSHLTRHLRRAGGATPAAVRAAGRGR
ncbi:MULTISPECIES: helix-turn-helix domain-containing protein [unclassified Modestobacter]|uniref:helix-turn-helix domain-containing protein n=1 Tax=unclassified Modestobacter TaxID=2643866 RepID=UPI0022AA9E7A|nr:MULTISPECIES: AraC family transcriptional regulator [unclassified Modestobacter]MCZ2826204.1 AraC family transcriptional regulator [Modestobacter sp. VKM Ac-2981]MCZ2852731.1 AraC family transcriptional regulator [Modestobacter sp. VKM Ac-2982]